MKEQLPFKHWRRILWRVVPTCGLVLSALNVAAEGRSVDILRIYYSDEAASGRVIDYDFTSGQTDAFGDIEIPNEAILKRPAEEDETVYRWEQFGAGEVSLLTTPPGVYRIEFPEEAFMSDYHYLWLSADSDVPPSGNWTWEVETRDGANVAIGVESEFFFPVARLEARFHGPEEGEPEVLVLSAALYHATAFFPVWTQTIDVPLNGAHAVSDPLALRLTFENNGLTMKTEYRLGTGAWHAFSEYSLPSGSAPVNGLWDNSVFVAFDDWEMFPISPMVVIENPEWDIVISSFGYADILTDRTAGFEGREYLSGEWGAAVAYTLAGSVPVGPTWLEPYFQFPDWETNSDFEEIATIERTAEDGSRAVSVIGNEHLEITQTFEMIDTVFGLPLGLTPADEPGGGGFVRSSRYALRQTYSIRNISGQTISDFQLFQFLHGLQSTRSLHDNRPYPGPYPEYRHTITQVGVDVPFSFDFDPFDEDSNWDNEIDVEFEDYIAFLASVPPDAFENGHFGIEGEDSHLDDKPSVGVHLSIEENNLNNLAYFAPDDLWVAGAQRWSLGELEPGATVSFDVLLTVATGTLTSPDRSSGFANGGAGVPGGVDFFLPGLTAEGTVFVRHLAADTAERTHWIEQGLLPEPDFDAGGDFLQAWDITTTALFDGPVLLSFGYDETLLRNGLPESQLAVFRWTGTKWEELERVVDPWNRVITVLADGFSWFALGVAGGLDSRFHNDPFSSETLSPLRWDAGVSAGGAAFFQEAGSLHFVSDATEDAVAGVISRSVFRLDETFRAAVAFDASGLSSSRQGELALAVVGADWGRQGTRLDDALFIANSTRQMEGTATGRKWVAARRADGEVDGLTQVSTDLSKGVLYLEYADGIFHLGYSGFGADHAFASFQIDDWDETDVVCLALLGFSNGTAFSVNDGISFNSFALERKPASAFAEWAMRITDPDQREPLGSVLDDGPPNLLRYATGVGPYESPSHHLPRAVLTSDNQPQIKFRYNTAARDLVTEVESTNDFEEWTVIARSAEGGPFEGIGTHGYMLGEDSTGEVSIAVPPSPEVPSRGFFRLKVRFTVD